jgi:hypothetical protein
MDDGTSGRRARRKTESDDRQRQDPGVGRRDPGLRHPRRVTNHRDLICLMRNRDGLKVWNAGSLYGPLTMALRIVTMLPQLLEKRLQSRIKPVWKLE